MTDNVNHPSHYADKEIEVIDYIRDTLDCTEFVGYCIGNVLKYTSRWRKKGGLEDLEKAKVYLDWAIQRQQHVVVKSEDVWFEGSDGKIYTVRNENSVGCPSPEDNTLKTIRCRFKEGKFANECHLRQTKGCLDCNWYLNDLEAEERGL